VRRVRDAAQVMRCWLRVHIGVGKQAADFRIWQQACSLGLRPCLSWAISPNWGNTRNLAVWCQFPGYTKSSNSKDDLFSCNEVVEWTWLLAVKKLVMESECSLPSSQKLTPVYSHSHTVLWDVFVKDHLY
jgi:hypothetical protein